MEEAENTVVIRPVMRCRRKAPESEGDGPQLRFRFSIVARNSRETRS
jgi:hypothetical protein